MQVSALCFSFDQGHRNRSIAFVASDGSVYKRGGGGDEARENATLRVQHSKCRVEEDFRKRAAHPLFVSEPPPVIGIKRGRFHDLFTRRSTPESNKPSRKMIKTVVSGKYRGKISCPTSTLFRLCSPLFFSASSSSSRRWRPPDWSLPPLWPWPQRWPPFQRPSSQLEAVKSWPGITTRWPPRRSLPPYPRPSLRHCRPRIHRSPSPRLRFTRHRSRTPRSTIPLLPYNSSP